MVRIDPITGVPIDENCGMYDYMLCGSNPGDMCFPWVGVFTMTTRIGLWLLFLLYAGGIAWKFHITDFHGTSRALGVVLALAIFCASLRVLRDVVIVTVSYQGQSSSGAALDFIWYMLPDVVCVLSMTAIYTQEFFALTANQYLRDKGNLVLWGSHLLFLMILIAGGIAVGFGLIIILPLIATILAISCLTMSFFLYFGDKVRKQLLSVGVDSSIQMGRDVGDFLARWMKVVTVCTLIFLTSTVAAITLSVIVTSYSSAVCAVIQLIHRFLEVVLLGFWVRHAGQVVDRARAMTTPSPSSPSQASDGSGHRRVSRHLPRATQSRLSMEAVARASSSRWERTLPVPLPAEICAVEMQDTSSHGSSHSSSDCSSSSPSRRTTIDSMDVFST